MGCSCERTKEAITEDDSAIFPECRLSIPCEGQFNSILAYDSNHLILGGNCELKMFDIKANEISIISNDIGGRINCLIKLPDGTVASGGQDSKIIIWDIINKKILYILEGHTSIIWDIKYVKTNMLISASDDNSSKIWNLKDKTSERFYSTRRHISCIAVLKNNKILLSLSKNLLLFDLETKEQEGFLEISVWSLKVLKNGDVAAGLCKGLLYIIEVKDEIKIKTEFAKGHNSTINFIIELDNGKLVTSADEDNLILWDRNNPDSFYVIRGHEDKVYSLCLIEKNKFASFAIDNTIKIWE